MSEPDRTHKNLYREMPIRGGGEGAGLSTESCQTTVQV